MATKQELTNLLNRYKRQKQAYREQIDAKEQLIERLSEAIQKLETYRDNFDHDRDGFNRTYIEGNSDWKGSLYKLFINQDINENVETPYSTGAKRINYFVGELDKKRLDLSMQVGDLRAPFGLVSNSICSLQSQIASMDD